MIAYTIIGFLALLGTLCGAMALMLAYQGRQSGWSAEYQPPEEGVEVDEDAEHAPLSKVTDDVALREVTDDDIAQFQRLVDEEAPKLLQHLIRYRLQVGAAGLKTLGEFYLTASSKHARNRLLEIFLKLYAVRIGDGSPEAALKDVLQEIKRLEEQNTDEGPHQLLLEIKRASPAQTSLLYLLSDLLEVTESNHKTIKDKLKNLSAQAVPSGGQGVEEAMSRLLSELTELVGQLSKTLPGKQKQEKAKETRRQRLEKSLKVIQDWADSCPAFKDATIKRTPEGMLAQKFLDKLWRKLDKLLTKSNRASRQIQAVAVSSQTLRATMEETGGRYKSVIALSALAIIFYSLAGALWLYLFSSRFEVGKALENIVQIETPAGGRGTGFFINQGNLIVSNHHVVSSFKEVTVKVKNIAKPDSQLDTFTAEILFSNSADDTAVLRVKSSEIIAGLPDGFQMERGDAFKIGQTVHILGNPVGLTDIYTQGRVMKIVDRTALMDVKIGPGNSGGPVCDDRGFVIGITTAYAKHYEGSFDYGIAISAEKAWRLIDQIKLRESLKLGSGAETK